MNYLDLWKSYLYEESGNQFADSEIVDVIIEKPLKNKLDRLTRLITELTQGLEMESEDLIRKFPLPNQRSHSVFIAVSYLKSLTSTVFYNDYNLSIFF